jgi:hypothetical protein
MAGFVERLKRRVKTRPTALIDPVALALPTPLLR